MALKKLFSMKGVTCPNGYWKVSHRAFNDIEKTGTVTVVGYYDKAARDTDVRQNALTNVSYNLTPEQYEKYFRAFGSDPIAQAYGFLKDQSEFTGAVDV